MIPLQPKTWEQSSGSLPRSVPVGTVSDADRTSEVLSMGNNRLSVLTVTTLQLAMLQVGKLGSSVEEKENTQLIATPLKLFQEKARWHTSLSRKRKIRALSIKDIFPCLLTPSLASHRNQRLLVTLQLPSPRACLRNISIRHTLYIATETAPIIIPLRLPTSEEQLTAALCFSHV